MNATTQIVVQTSTDTLSIRVRVDHLDLHSKILKGTCYADNLISKYKSILGNTVANLYTQGRFVKGYPIAGSRESGQSLTEFTENVGISETLLTNGAGEFTGQNTYFVKHTKRMRIQLHNLEQGRHNQNHAAECEIGFLANRWRR